MRKVGYKRISIFVAVAILLPMLIFRPALAAVAFLAVSTASNGGSTSLSLTEPTGTSSNDVMIAVISVRGGTGTSITAPSGWQLVDSRDSTTVLKSAVYYGIRAVVGAGPYSFTFPSQKASAVVTSYSGVDVFDPVDVASGQANASLAVATAPSITTTEANAMVVGAYSTARGTTYSSSTMTFHAGALASSTGGSGTTQTTSAMTDSIQASPGSTGTKTLTFGAAAVNIGHLLALKPAASVSQVGYRFFANADSYTPGSPLAANNTQATVENGTPFRLRLNLGVSSSEGSLSPNSSYKLQYALSDGTCDTAFSGETYSDINGITPIRPYVNATPINGNAYSTTGNDPTRVGITSVGQRYVEGGAFTAMTVTPSNQDALWDFSLTTSGTTPGQQYCIRAINSVNGSYYVLEGGYGVVPSILIPTPTVTQANYRWFENANSATPGAALAAQDTATSRAVSTPFRLRQRLAVDTATLASAGQAFKLQYAEKSGTCDIGFTGETYTDVTPVTTPGSEYAGTAANDTSTGAGSTPWSNPTNAVGASNSSFASISSPFMDATNSNWLKATNYGFNIPTNATITSVSVQIFGGSDDSSGNGLSGRAEAKLVKGGTIQGTGRGPETWDSGTQPSSITDSPAGWGVTLSPADVNASDFGFAVIAQASYDVVGDFFVEVYIDSIEIAVYYTLPDNPIAYYNNASVSNPTTISSSGNDPTNASRPTVYQSYLETDSFTNNVAAISSGSDGIWDFALTSNSLASGKTYCLRTVKSNGSLLDTYSQIPEITINSAGTGPTLEQATRGGGGVINGVKQNFSW